jgi:AraC-like DNA-binding protein
MAHMTDLDDIRALALRNAGNRHPSLSRLYVYRTDTPTAPGAFLYDPLVCLVVQGSKRTFIGDQVLEYGAGDCIVVAAEVAAIGQVCEASTEDPYLGLNLYLDPAVIASVLLDLAALHDVSVPLGYGVARAGAPLLDAWRRYVKLLDHPEEIPVMAAHLEHELMFRLLSGPQGALLRQIAGSDSRLASIRRAMTWIRDHFAERLSIEAMATVAGMSVSVFHRRFKAVNGLSPLQYQKQVRLHDARRRLLSEHAEAATVAYAVGYESASQFSREYKRLFGAPPRRDVEAIETKRATLETGP